MDEQLTQYREFLIASEQKSQESYDRTVLTLSGGALGLSMTFIKDIVGTANIHSPELLKVAWLAWGLSVSLVLFSHLASGFAFRRARIQVDRNIIYDKKAGGCFGTITQLSNMFAGLLFVAGAYFMGMFVYSNLG